MAPAIHALLFLSGVAGLGYELLWTRQFALGLGHEYPAALAVVAAFFAGLALGAAAADGPVSRSKTPGRWYAACELLIGGWALVTLQLIPFLNQALAGWIGVTPTPTRQWTLGFVVPFFALLPATAAMGATLPAIERLYARARQTVRGIGGLYAANTLGAVGGVVASVYVLLPLIGQRHSVMLLAALNFACALLAWFGPLRGELARSEPRSAPPTDLSTTRLWVTLALTGLAGVALEVLTVRILSTVLESTIYTFAATLSVYLLGTAAGASLYQAWPAPRSAARRLQSLLVLLLLACVLAFGLLGQAARVYDKLHANLGGGATAGMAAEIMLTALILGAPTLAMGACFSHLATCARSARGGVGRALGVNTLGGALAPLLFGVLLLPVLGSRLTFMVAIGAYLLLLPRIRSAGFAVATAAIGLAFVLPNLTRQLVPAGAGRLLELREGVQSTALVLETGADERVLKVNRTFRMGGTGRGAFAQLRMGHLPLALHPEPKRALFLGLGTGVTFAAAAAYPGLEADGVELSPEVVALLPYFEAANGPILGSERLQVFTADARRFVRTVARPYDVIVADLFHPARDGAASLYTIEHFAAIRARLRAGGLFCQWLPLYQMDGPTTALIVRSFATVFPEGVVLLAYYNVETPIVGLLGWVDEQRITLAQLGARFSDSRFLREIRSSGLDLLLEPLAAPVMTITHLRQRLGAEPVNTDDRPRLTFAALQRAYARTNPGPGQLAELIAAAAPPPLQALVRFPAGEADYLVAALDAYRAGRDEYLQALLSLQAGDVNAAARHALASLRTSVDQEIGYALVIELARQAAGRAPAEARKWLTAAAQLRPQRPEAPALLRALEANRGP